ncbi:MAG: purine-nucleoside phosphorylase [Gemmatimonadota bacterium]
MGARLGGFRARLGLVLGSGLGGLAERFEEARVIPYSELPAWPPVGVVGHEGKVVAGTLGGVPAIALTGRAHLYEGHSPDVVVTPVRALATLGIRALFVSNAAGGINRLFRPGDLMLICDHLNLMWRNPLIGPVKDGESRWPDMHDCYDSGLRASVRDAAREARIPLREGVYAGLLGPSYETPAEVRMIQRFGADAVGMSTVPEVLAARARGVRCFGVSCITNLAAGISPEPLTHDEVLETTARVAEAFQRLVLVAVERIGREGRLD